jgi:hypothetical protein
MNYRIVTVHGTFSASHSIRGSQWWQRESPFAKELLSFIDCENFRVTWDPFPWSGENSIQARERAAHQLYKAGAQRNDFREISVYLCHSHGGNIFQGARPLWKAKGQRPYSINIGTPFLAEISTESFRGLAVLRRLGSICIYVSMLSFMALELFTLPLNVDKILYLAIAVCIIALLLLFYVRLILSILRFVFSDQSSIMRRILMWDKRIHGGKGREAVTNSNDVKIYSIWDEAIAALKHAYTQRIEVATKRNMLVPAAFLWAIVTLVAILVSANVVGVQILSDPMFGDYLTLRKELAPDGFPVDQVNILADITLVLLSCAFIGLMIAESGGATLLARVFNRNLTRILIEKAYGRDSAFSVFIPERVSANLPTLFHKFSDDERWKPMPKEFDDELRNILAEGTAETARAIRETVALGMLTGSTNFFDSISKSLSGDELIHTSYFRHKDFPAFIAWILVEKFSFPPSPQYSKIDKSRFDRWFGEIAPALANLAQTDSAN